jgi:osmoprotectant transport system permease protein
VLRLLVFVAFCACGARSPDVTVGSKAFTESVVLGELARHLASGSGARAAHRAQLGGTQVLWKALLRGDVDAYPEYTGTLREEVLRGTPTGEEALRAALAIHGVRMTRPLGFNNTYALGMREDTARRLGVRTISDLKAHPRLALGFSSEFLRRADGWPSLRDRYRLPQANVRGLDHDLAYRGIASGALDVIDLYSTDAEIRHYGLRVLEDDLGHFPRYDAVLLYRADLESRATEIVAAFRRLAGRVGADEMRAMNARAKLDRVPECQVAADFARERLGEPGVRCEEIGLAGRLWATTADHLFLVGLSLAAAILAAVPLGILAARRPRLGQVLLAVAGVVQTLPSLALLVFMIPFFGIGAAPAIVALFLYSLLPIVRNTYTGLRDVSPGVRESAEALGLPPRARLWLVELPLASRAILAGVKTSAVINVGTATLGALVGAGGYGEPILTGIRLDDLELILQGAVPAAALALLTQGVFELLERVLVPKGLRIS